MFTQLDVLCVRPLIPSFFVRGQSNHELSKSSRMSIQEDQNTDVPKIVKRASIDVSLVCFKDGLLLIFESF